LLRVLLLGCCLSCSADVTVGFDGKPLAAVVVAAESPEQVTTAAGLLAKYVLEATGATLPVVKEGEPVPDGLPARIYIGQTAYALRITLRCRRSDRDTW